MSQSQNVYIYTHKQHSQRAPARVKKDTLTTTSPPVMVPFVVPLPPEHPFNTNRPQNQSGVSATVPINKTTTTTPAVNPTVQNLQNTPIKLKKSQKMLLIKPKGLSKYDLEVRAQELGIDITDLKTKPKLQSAINEAESKLKSDSSSSNPVV